MSIHRLPTLQEARGTDLVALWSSSTGADSKIPASKLPISTAVQEALDALETQLSVGGPINALSLLSEEEIAEVRDPSGAAGADLAPKIQAALDAAYLLTGNDQSGAGGHGVCMDFDPGTWTLSTLQLKPGMALRGLTDRFEVRFKQISTAQAPLIDVLGRGQNQDVIGRRTAVILQRLDLNANGNLDTAGDPINCINLRVDAANEGDDDSANRTGVIADEVQAGGASGWGLYNLKRGKLWLNKCQFAGNGQAPLLPNNKVGGLFSQGPDCFFHKVYCGNNGGPQMHIKSSATPSITEIELGTSTTPQTYPSLYIENCTDMMVGAGGNCTGWILIEGQEDDPAANEYDTDCRINLFDFGMTFKDKTFTDSTVDPEVVYTQPGFIVLKNVRGVHVDNVRFRTAVDDDIAAHHYTNRPTSIIHVIGARTRGTGKFPLPPLTDWNWPAGTPEVYAGPPTNTYDSITNKPDQFSVQTCDPTDTTHAWLFDRIRFLTGLQGMTSGGNVPAGYVGELISTDVTTSAPVSLTTNTITNIGSIVLTAGEWDIRATLIVQGTGCTATFAEAAVSTANNTIPGSTAQRYAAQALNLTTVTNPLCTLQMGSFQLKLSAGATRYLNAKAVFSAGTAVAYGVIEARRVA